MLPLDAAVGSVKGNKPMSDDPTASSWLAGYRGESSVAIDLDVKVRTLRLWRQQRRGPPYIKLGPTILYPEDGFRDWLKTLHVAGPAVANGRRPS